MRAIAAACDVDSALVSYHFGGKQALYAEALALPCADPSALDRALDGDHAGLAHRLLDAVTAQWDAADPAEIVVVARDEATMSVLRDYLDSELRPRIAEFLGGTDATQRAVAAVGVIGGVIFTRYLGPLPGVVALRSHQVRRTFAPALHAALWSTQPGRPVRTGAGPGPATGTSRAGTGAPALDHRR